MSASQLARRLLRSQRYGMLSTLSIALEGYPFGSVVDYIVDHEARPVLLISGLAEHTKNIKQDPRVSLLVHQATHDVQASPRLTVSGLALPLAAQETNSMQLRYLQYFPDTAHYFELDFSFFRIEPVKLRYIGGPGAMCWLSSTEYTPPYHLLTLDEASIISHMNHDHAPALPHYCQQYHGVTAMNVSMLGIDCDGFDVRADSQLLRFEFNEPILSAQDARKALVSMSQANQHE